LGSIPGTSIATKNDREKEKKMNDESSSSKHASDLDSSTLIKKSRPISIDSNVNPLKQVATNITYQKSTVTRAERLKVN
jgi:hypothetical protein